MSGTSNPQSQVRPAVQAAAYAIGASIGGLLVFPYIASVSGGAAIVQGASVTFASGVIPTMDLVLFSASPTASTVTDRTAVAIAAADLAKVIGVLHLTDTALLGASAPSVVQATTAVMPFDLPTGTSLYAALIARSGVTLGSTTDVTISLNVIWG
jgi:hypothetical protein